MINQHKRRTPKDPDDLIASLADQSINLTDLAEEQSISPATLLRWCASDTARKRFERHAAIYARAAQLALSRASAHAAHALLKLALDNAAPETARKACVDLIKLAPPHAPPNTPLSHPAQSHAVQDDEALISALSEKLTQPIEPTDN